MGNREVHVKVPKEYVENLRTNTTYTKGEINHLYNRFLILTKKGRPYILKRDLYLTNDLRLNPITPMIANALFGSKQKIKFVEFAKFLHIFKVQDHSNSEETDKRLDTKLKLLFNMYDANRDGRITKEELFDIVHRMFSDQMDYNDCTRIVEVMVAEADTTETSQILFNDFCNSFNDIDVDKTLMIKIHEA